MNIIKKYKINHNKGYKAIQEIDLNILQYNNKQIIKTEWIFKLKKKIFIKMAFF